MIHMDIKVGTTFFICLLGNLKLHFLPAGQLAAMGERNSSTFCLVCAKAEAVEFAENLRAEIGRHDFTIIPDLVEDKYPLIVHITSSIGVSSSPVDTDEAMTFCEMRIVHFI